MYFICVSTEVIKKILIAVINDGSTDNTKYILDKYKNIKNLEIIS